MSQRPYDAIIVGGGHNGLVAAAYLARAGLEVLVLERRHMVGGACATEEVFPGFHVSTCSYIVHGLQDAVVKDLDLHRHGYHVQQYDPTSFLPLPDGRYLLLWRDSERTCEEIARFSRHDADGYRRWDDFWQQAARLFQPFFMTEPPTLAELRDQVRGTPDESILDRLVTGTLTELMDEYFDTEQAKLAVLHTMDTTDPDEPGVLFGKCGTLPGRFADRRNQGIVTGGMSGLTAAMARAVEGFGGNIRLGAEVRRILVEDNHVAGVELSDGQVFRSKLVLSNADPKRTFLHLVGRENLDPAVTAYITALRTDFGSLKFHAAVDELPDFSRYLGPGYDPRYTAMIRLCPSIEYYRNCSRDVAEGRPTRYPLIDIQIPTVYDHTVAPRGKHIVSMWVRYEPSHPTGVTWDDIREAQGNLLIDAVNAYAPNFRKSLIDWLVYTPADLERRVGLTDGNIHHLTHALGQLLGDRLFTRGGYRTPVAGLYMCGAGAHPGGEVSGAPGHNAAHAVLADLRAAA